VTLPDSLHGGLVDVTYATPMLIRVLPRLCALLGLIVVAGQVGSSDGLCMVDDRGWLLQAWDPLLLAGCL